MPRGEGVGCHANLDGHEGGEEGWGDGKRDDGLLLGPALVAAVVETQEEAEHGRDEKEGAEEVDPGELLPPVGVVPLWEVQHEVDGDECYHDHWYLPDERPMVVTLAISSHYTPWSSACWSSSLPTGPLWLKGAHSPSPTQRIRKKTAQRRARGSPCAEDDVHVPLPDATLPQGHDVSQQDGDDGIHTATADAGHGP